ncbi:MAG: hypothetical protein ABIA91_00060 [Patescibacteria group bacterium]
MKYTDFYNLFKNRYPILSRAEIKKISENKVLDIQLSDWVKKGFLIKPRKNVYLLKENADINSFVLANKIFEPSYVSLESALFYYNLIPDVVMAVTSVTAKKTRRFEFNSKLFVYQKIKSDIFLGYQEIKDINWGFLIALPEKAILDYFYLHQGELNNQNDWKELRINHEIYVKQIKRNKLLKLSKFFNNSRFTNLIKGFDKYIREEYASI